MKSTIASVAALLLSCFFMLMAAGLSGYLIPLRAVTLGWSTLSISMMATGYSIAFTASCIITPRLVRQVGHVRVFGVLTTLLSMSLLLHALIAHPVAWVLFRAIAGFSMAGGYMVIESWLNERVSNESRGALFSVYMVTCMAALTVGQYIVPLGDPTTTVLFMVCALIFSLAIVPTALSSAQSPQPLTQVKFDVPGLYRRSPAAVVGTLIAGIIAGAWSGLAPVYASRLGLSTTEGASMLAVAMIGGTLFQYPLGRASDKMDRRRVMVFGGIVGLLACIAVVSFGVESHLTFFVMMFVLGTVLFPIYSLNVAHANDYARPDEFVEVSSGLLIVYGFGAMSGPLLAGTAMDIVGPWGLFATMGAGFLCYALYAAWRMTRRTKPPEETRSEFRAMAPAREHTPQTAELDPRSDPETPEPAAT
ncbi:putative MFS family arabinose efflux permease [Hoeflea marina]|uniref:Putative MFS family arabinose efflux permease n=1 Tax=Hoeflea marina TaxID=274592 RepID=A0A317PRQ3_9HYPH|nr:MFS transporter [Hoeflea marina]PWW02250.1 putative MFS family arabinose efflux permease [Hoeflea marina]